MITNTAYLCRPDITIQHNDQILYPEQINDLIEYYMEQFYDAFNGDTLGKSVLLNPNNLDIVYPVVMAAWRLGMSTAQHEFNIVQANHPAWRDFYEYIDCYVAWDTDYAIGQLELRRPIIFAQHIITKDGLQPIKKATRKIPDVEIQPTTAAVKTHTSGTTGFPKVLEISHHSVQENARAIIEMYDHNNQDIVLHHKTMHHGSLFLNFGLPSWMMTSKHHCIQKDSKESGRDAFLTKAVEYCNKNKITKWMVVYNWIRRLPDLDLEFDHTIDLVTILGPTSDEMHRLLEKTKPRRVYHNFGNTEVGNLYLSVTDLDNVDTYNPNRFPIQNPSSEIHIDDQTFDCRTIGSDRWYKIGDKLEIIDGVMWWRGRTDAVIKNDKKIKVLDVQGFIEKHYDSREFYVVGNYLTNQMFLALFDNLDTSNLNNVLEQEFGIANILDDIKIVPYTEYLHGQKPSMPLLLYLFKIDEDPEYV